jgi:hypothetical protein
MYEQDIRAGVLDADHMWTPEFESWAELTLQGAYTLKQDDMKLSVQFESEDDATAYTLTWCDPVVTYPKIILPLMRRVMPTIIAQDILGVSPFTAPDPKWTQLLKDISSDV